MASPVAGFRPMRALRFTRTILPSPGIVKEFLAFLYASATRTSMVCTACFRMLACSHLRVRDQCHVHLSRRQNLHGLHGLFSHVGHVHICENRPCKPWRFWWRSHTRTSMVCTAC